MPKKKDQVFYQLTVTEKQLRLINTALEEYFRLGLNQWWDLADRLSRIGVDLSPEHPNHKWIFDTMIHTRDDVRIVLETAGRILWPHGLTKQDEENILLQDIWQVIRHQLWLDDPDREKRGYCVDGNKPFIQGSEPIALCVKCEKPTSGRANDSYRR